MNQSYSGPQEESELGSQEGSGLRSGGVRRETASENKIPDLDRFLSDVNFGSGSD